MSKEFIEGERYPVTPEDAQALINLSGSSFTALIVGAIDCSRGRRLVKSPGDWELWNQDGKKVKASISGDGVFISVEREVDQHRPEPLS